MYNISDYSFKQANKLGVSIKPSTNKNKKIDVFKDGDKIASIGASGMPDYPTYIKTKGQDYATQRRRLFKARFQSARQRVGTPAYFADKILW
jgi:hypothetical protein